MANLKILLISALMVPSILSGQETIGIVAGERHTMGSEIMGSQFVIPELIVVAIFHEDRKHDLTPTHCTATNDGFESDGLKVSGGGEKFLQFIEKELIPGIERDYRTATCRILSGHSLGGLFAVYAYLNRNSLFDAFIAMDPALN